MSYQLTGYFTSRWAQPSEFTNSAASCGVLGVLRFSDGPFFIWTDPCAEPQTSFWPRAIDCGHVGVMDERTANNSRQQHAIKTTKTDCMRPAISAVRTDLYFLTGECATARTTF